VKNASVLKTGGNPYGKLFGFLKNHFKIRKTLKKYQIILLRLSWFCC